MYWMIFRIYSMILTNKWVWWVSNRWRVISLESWHCRLKSYCRSDVRRDVSRHYSRGVECRESSFSTKSELQNPRVRNGGKSLSNQRSGRDGELLLLREERNLGDLWDLWNLGNLRWKDGRDCRSTKFVGGSWYSTNWS